MVKIHGKEYEEVKDRITKLRAQEGRWTILTWVDWHNDNFSACVFGCEIQKDGMVTSTGYAYEERIEGRESEVNTTSWVENCETSAIGRALANLGIGGTQQRPSAEEMQKVERMKPPPKDDEAKRFADAMDAVKADFTKEIGSNLGEACWGLMMNGKKYEEFTTYKDRKEKVLSAREILKLVKDEAKRICGVHGTDKFSDLAEEKQKEILVPIGKMCLLA